MTPPDIEASTREEPFDSAQDRLAYVRERWECMHNCELCGHLQIVGAERNKKCHILKGRDAETLYADYIEGKRSYLEITLELRKQGEQKVNSFTLCRVATEEDDNQIRK